MGEVAAEPLETSRRRARRPSAAPAGSCRVPSGRRERRSRGRGRGWPRRRCPRPAGRRAAGPATGSRRSSRRGRSRSACVANDRLRHERAAPAGAAWSSAPEGSRPRSRRLSPAPFVSGCWTRTSSPVRSPPPEFTPSNRARPANATTWPPWPIRLNPLPRLPWSRRRREWSARALPAFEDGWWRTHGLPPIGKRCAGGDVSALPSVPRSSSAHRRGGPGSHAGAVPRRLRRPPCCDGRRAVRPRLAERDRDQALPSNSSLARGQHHPPQASHRMPAPPLALPRRPVRSHEPPIAVRCDNTT